MAAAGDVGIRREAYGKEAVTGAGLVVAATDDQDLNNRIAGDARADSSNSALASGWRRRSLSVISREWSSSRGTDLPPIAIAVGSCWLSS